MPFTKIQIVILAHVDQRLKGGKSVPMPAAASDTGLSLLLLRCCAAQQLKESHWQHCHGNCSCDLGTYSTNLLPLLNAKARKNLSEVFFFENCSESLGFCVLFFACSDNKDNYNHFWVVRSTNIFLSYTLLSPFCSFQHLLQHLWTKAHLSLQPISTVLYWLFPESDESNHKITSISWQEKLKTPWR